MKRFPQYNWDHFKKFEFVGIWFIQDMYNADIRDKLQLEIKDKYYHKEFINKNGQFELNYLMKKMYPESVEG